jgi:hypothetical protein
MAVRRGNVRVIALLIYALLLNSWAAGIASAMHVAANGAAAFCSAGNADGTPKAPQTKLAHDTDCAWHCLSATAFTLSTSADPLSPEFVTAETLGTLSVMHGSTRHAAWSARAPPMA